MPRVYDVLYTTKQDNPNNRGKKMSIGRKELLMQLMQIRDLDELRLIRSAIDDRIKEVASLIKYDLLPGDKVSINSKRINEDGVIKKVNRTRAVVLIDGKQWNVPFALITKQ